MVKKTRARDDNNTTASPISGGVKDSARQIWLAGLGAFARAQEEGGKVFDTLVKDGLSIQRKTQVAAEESLAQTSDRMAKMTSDIQSKAVNPWGKLENIFEDRVAKALDNLRVPSAKTVDELLARVEVLEQKLAANPPAPRKSRSKTTATPQEKPKSASTDAARKTAAPAAVKAPSAKKPAAQRKPR
ncbi:MAG: poly granule associated protein [Comamonadaceae bacterium]|nr:MAG: poly granule associated protein [Comamonadaceae bacterium]